MFSRVYAKDNKKGVELKKYKKPPRLRRLLYQFIVMRV
jgi:hypothetical protein